MDYEELSLAVQKGKAKLVKELVNKGLEEGAPVKDILEKGLISAMGIVGEDFRNGKIFVPEMLVAARAMSAGVKILEPLFSDSALLTTTMPAIGDVIKEFENAGVRDKYYIMVGGAPVTQEFAAGSMFQSFSAENARIRLSIKENKSWFKY